MHTKHKMTINDICSDYILSVAQHNGINITRLEMQKLLYYIQVRYYLRTQKFLLIQSEMKAFPYGPVFLDQLNRFKKESDSLDISYDERFLEKDEVKEKLDDIQRESIMYVMKNMLKKNIFQVVDDTHRELPWRENWKEENKKYSTIEPDYIIRFCEEIKNENKSHWINGN